jgi:hypothetical protein
MLLSEWKKTAPNREAMSNKVLAVLKPVLADLGADGDPACWVLWGEDPEFRYSVMAPTQAGLVTVAVRLNSGSGDGPRATGKLIRWGKLQVSDLGVESADRHRLVAVQVEGQVLKGVDEEADRICEFLLGLVAGVDGRAYRVAAPVVVQAVPPDVTIPKPAVDKPEAPKAGAKSGLKAVPAPLAASGAAKGPAKEVAEGAPVAGDQPPARKPAKTPGGKTRAAWVAPHPIGLPAPQTPTPAVAPLRLKPPAAKPEAAKPPASPAAHPAAAARSAEPAEGGPVWEVPEPSDREVKRPRTWTP